MLQYFKVGEDYIHCLPQMYTIIPVNKTNSEKMCKKNFSLLNTSQQAEVVLNSCLSLLMYFMTIP
jgi:hypothetical protein